ncbi:hypothetical protein HZB02_00265 [Candidatus Woesearchaeota archaeon]|nr:hypothetical protein [Candidatus Woesearchaeota archaeon]
MPYTRIAFDGLSLAGKSTMVQMLLECSLDAVVIRENTLDPYRPMTSRVNKLLKEKTIPEVIDVIGSEFSQHASVLHDAFQYASAFGSSQNQAMLAYLFTTGRKEVALASQPHLEEQDVIHDRWKLSGCGYQVDLPAYTWKMILDLNDRFEIPDPHAQFLLTCPLTEIPLRKQYREKQGTGTAGQMSKGKEHIILPAFLAMSQNADLQSRFPIYLLENKGNPVDDLQTQILQALPANCKIEEAIRGSTSFRFKEPEIIRDPSFWLEPTRLQRIYGRQTG